MASEIDLKSDAEQSLFCDAMELTRKSSGVSQPRSFWTIYRVTHMIRSGLSIDLLLVALIISTGFSEGRAARRSMQQDQCRLCVTMRQQILRFSMFLEPKSMKFGPWAPPNCWKIEANGATKTKVLPRFSKSHDFLKILRFLYFQIGPQNH